jgi:prephenate dehydrogenase
MMSSENNQLLIIGCGLIGGSFALAAKKAGLVESVTGVDSSQEVLDQALQLGIIDTAMCSTDSTKGYTQALDSVLPDTNIILVAVPVSLIANIVIDLFQRGLSENCLIFDVGSVKHKIIEDVQAGLGRLPPAFIPVHPIAGSEQHGPAAASADLFSNRTVVFTPHSETSESALKQVRELWLACGAHVSELDSARHDQILAATSHLPHLLSFGLMAWLDKQHSDDVLEFAAGGLRDFSRIAESDPDMWANIFEDNAKNLVPQINELLQVILDIRTLIEKNDTAGLRECLSAARKARLRLIDKIGKA